MKTPCLFILLILAINAKGQLAEKFKREAQYQHLNGVILVKRSDSIFFQGCYGTSDGINKNTSQTRFDIGSITKQFTAAAVLQLVKEENLSINSPINTYLGNLASKKWSKVTIHHLLTHTSGIPSPYQTEQGIDLFLPEEEPILFEQLVNKFKDAKLLFSPGEEFSYSNSGYMLLSAIIEKVSGKSYSEFMETEIFSRYGLINTSVGKPSFGACATPYYGYRNDLQASAPQYHVSWFQGSGGVYSTVVDLAKWVEVINSTEFLDDELRRLFLKSHVNVGYGYGWQYPKGTDIIQHDGGNAGFISMLSFNPKTRETVVILTNRSFEFDDIYKFWKSAEYVGEWTKEIWAVLSNEEVTMLPKYQPHSSLNAEYKLSNGPNVHVKKHDSLLSIKADKSFPSRLVTNTPLAGDNEQECTMIDIARYLEKSKYWSLAKHCDGEMKFVMYSGMMSIVMRMLKKKVGEAVSFIPYYVEDGYGLIRVKGTERNMDLITYFDSKGKLMGLFENGFLELDKETPMLAYPTNEGKFYLDGLPYGEESSTITISSDTITFYQLNRSVSGVIK